MGNYIFRVLIIVGLLAFVPSVESACTAVSGYTATEITLADPGVTMTRMIPFNNDGSNLSSLKSAMQAAMQADGDDIRFTRNDADGGASVAYTFVKYDSSTGSLQAFIGPLAFTSGSSLNICVNYGNGGASSGSSATPLADYEFVLTADSTTDLTGNGHDATLNSITTTAGPWGTAWVLNADSDHVELADTGAAGELTDEVYGLTVIANSDSLVGDSDRERVVDRDSTTNDWPVLWWADSFDSTNPGHWFTGGGFDKAQWDSSSTSGTWYHIAMVRDRTTDNEAYAFLDGVLIETDSGLAANNTPNNNISIGSDNSGFGWQGSVNAIMWRNDDLCDNAACQDYEYNAFMNPNSVFSIPSAPAGTGVSYPIVNFRFYGSILLPSLQASTLCASALVDLGAGACPAEDYGLEVLMGDGR